MDEEYSDVPVGKDRPKKEPEESPGDFGSSAFEMAGRAFIKAVGGTPTPGGLKALKAAIKACVHDDY